MNIVLIKIVEGFLTKQFHVVIENILHILLTLDSYNFTQHRIAHFIFYNRLHLTYHTFFLVMSLSPCPIRIKPLFRYLSGK